MTETISETVSAIMPELIRDPPRSPRSPRGRFKEVRTTGIVAAKLREWGIDVTEGVGRTGVVGTLRGNRPGQRAIGLRADMDALNILEATGLPYASTISDKMHGCGHDGHTAVLLGAAYALSRHRFLRAPFTPLYDVNARPYRSASATG